MSRRRELQRRLTGLQDISGILSAMRSLAHMEVRALQEYRDCQQRMLAAIERAVAAVLRAYPGLLPPADASRQTWVVIGAEQGFCGDFNDAVKRRLEQAVAAGVGPDHCVFVGRRLARSVTGSGPPMTVLAGATVADEVGRVLERLAATLRELASAGPAAGSAVLVLHQDDAGGEVHLRSLLPPRPPAAAEAPSGPAPETNLPPSELLVELAGHLLHALLNEALYSSLMAENRRRLEHMENALHRVDRDMDRLRLACNARRQEEITEEIEVLLLSAEAVGEVNE